MLNECSSAHYLSVAHVKISVYCWIICRWDDCKQNSKKISFIGILLTNYRMYNFKQNLICNIICLNPWIKFGGPILHLMQQGIWSQIEASLQQRLQLLSENRLRHITRLEVLFKMPPNFYQQKMLWSAQNQIRKGYCTCEVSIDVDNARKQSIYGYAKETTSVVKSIATCVKISLMKIWWESRFYETGQRRIHKHDVRWRLGQRWKWF